ncbi:D-hexose-6-phosphate mutarotase [Undibacterium griseum]|uniref:Putative glucose-6-phosphate 1-epimerase n=1 Tax=Undibacterium griseum TaxID=2762295 RepID=A0ABR6YIA1_9BURK|nr:D-hexose-6-phosphate mutarotase [Undibacterium griseum]MBC3883635.1 D-hexose-6-phosphate mutarotase [Undibacterium griseum]
MEFLQLTAADGATTTICHQGAHVCSWIPAGGTEQLFMSKASAFRQGVAIRGGIPLIFPQFSGLGSLPKHGFARTADWQLRQQRVDSDGAALAVFSLKENIASLTLWPHVFEAELTVRVLGQALEVTFSVRNTGDTAFSFTSALHTYLALDDIRQARLHGLQGTEYRDTVSGQEHCPETSPALEINGETDRIYANVPATLTLAQPQQRLQITSIGFPDAVVWNPGATGAVKISDLEPGGEQRMLCVEAAAVLHPVQLLPGQQWNGSQRLMRLPPQD